MQNIATPYQGIEEVILVTPEGARELQEIWNYMNTEESVPRKPRRKAGSAKGLIAISEDFDEPLEDFEEYMR